MTKSKCLFFAGIAMIVAFAGCTNSSTPNGAAATGETNPAGVGGTTAVPAASSTTPGGNAGGR